MRPVFDQFVVGQHALRQHDDLGEVRIMAQHFLAVFRHVGGDGVALVVQMRRNAGRPQGVAIAADADDAGLFRRTGICPRFAVAVAARLLLEDEQE